MGLHEDPVNVTDVDISGSVSDSFEKRGDGEISGAPEDAFAASDDEGEGVFGEGGVRQAHFFELMKDEFFHVVRSEFLQQNGVGDTAFDVFVWCEGQLCEQVGLCDEDEVVVFGKVFEEQSESAQGIGFHEVGVIDDGDEHFAAVVDAVGFFDEALFAGVTFAVGIDLKRLAQNSDGAEVGVQGAVDDGGNHLFCVMPAHGLLEN